MGLCDGTAWRGKSHSCFAAFDDEADSRLIRVIDNILRHINSSPLLTGHCNYRIIIASSNKP